MAPSRLPSQTAWTSPPFPVARQTDGRVSKHVCWTVPGSSPSAPVKRQRLWPADAPAKVRKSPCNFVPRLPALGRLPEEAQFDGLPLLSGILLRDPDRHRSTARPPARPTPKYPKFLHHLLLPPTSHVQSLPVGSPAVPGHWRQSTLVHALTASTAVRSSNSSTMQDGIDGLAASPHIRMRVDLIAQLGHEPSPSFTRDPVSIN
ncbi:hypothetical protein BS50DRAFT_240781 [Corynespora cassiicola Philippines]|uniref:Uncharacterized protein n=1 Tax=Corynespora cassiicola Philippines TaxID=1448308 RepID=A0A2T2P2Z2_CORCC|nr:hypothetical protein BS50DRAFT_240781 [Corynespora cassiicola Philippines]